MKFSLCVLSVALLATTFVTDVLGAVGAPNSFSTPRPSGICKHSHLRRANGTQIKDGFCASTIMGEVPSAKHMTSTLILNPSEGSRIKQGKSINVLIKVLGLETGFFTDPQTDYYDLPQQLNRRGIIQGHTHVTIQKLNGNQVPDPTLFAFFKGLNDPAKNGKLSVVVPPLAPGKYRLCTMSSSFSHQPLVMPVAQRGAQDDCVRFTVVKK